MKKSINAKGLACPQPVILCRKAMAETAVDELEIIVDNEPARQNVLRFLRFTGAPEPTVASRGTVHAISAVVTAAMRDKAKGDAPAPACDEEDSAARDRVTSKTLFLSSDQIGRGEEALGRLLVRGFLHTIGELDALPRTLILMNSGVRLATENDETVRLLKKAEARGVEILVCGTCLDYYHLTDKLRVGRISNLYEIAGKFLETSEVVTVS